MNSPENTDKYTEEEIQHMVQAWGEQYHLGGMPEADYRKCLARLGYKATEIDNFVAHYGKQNN